MKIMSVNAGSSSLKFSLFEMDTKEVIASGYFERVTLEGSFYTIKYNGEKIREEVNMPNHTVAVEVMLDRLIKLGIIQSLDEIEGVGHRAVHGSDVYKESVLITDKVMEDIDKFKSLAPLHNPANLLGIQAVKKALPNVPMVAVFDTAFHQTMSEENYIYPVPYEWYTKYGVRKYGFHGTSHQYISQKIQEILGTDKFRAIICHIGSGGSITAVKDGRCVDTTMGFTPLAGIVMGTRSGDIDPSIIPYVMEQEGLNAKEVVDELNKKSGLLGISGVGSDHRDIEEGMRNQNERCFLAEKILINSIVKYIAQYYVELGGCDMLVFTAGLGENAIDFRANVLTRLAPLGIIFDPDKNNFRGETREISHKDSPTKIYVIPTNEELMIALETLRIIQNR